jgi:hypothetical protein
MADSLSLSEPVLDAIIFKLKNGVAARIAAINAETTDNVTLGVPLDDDFYLGGAANIPGGRTPAFIITDGGSAESGGFTEEGPHSLVLTLSVIVFMLDEDSDRQRLARRLLRLERAVIETLWDDPPLERVIINDSDQPYISPVRVQPGPVFNPEVEGEPYRQWRAVVFTVLKHET